MRHAAPFTIIVLAAVAMAAAGCEDDPEHPSDPAPEIDAGPTTPDGGPVVVDCPAPTSGPTRHQGDVEGEEVWTADTGPHIVEHDLRVRDGAKLTIEPCARVELAEGKHIYVAYPGTPNEGGTLIAEGTAQRPITFTGHEGARWSSLYVVTPGTVRLAHVTLEGGGAGRGEDRGTINAFGDSTMPADPVLFVDHVTIKDSATMGIWMHRGATFLEGSRDLTITGSGDDEAPFPLQIEEHAIDRVPTGSYTGNRVDEILVRSVGTGVAGTGLSVDATLRERGVPYRMTNAPRETFIIGTATDGELATLTIEPGVVMRFSEGSSFAIQRFTSDKPSTGVVRALGTADKPIVFTSASETPQPGDWAGLWFGGVPSASNRLEHVRIEYAGADCSCSLNTCSQIDSHQHAAVIFTAQPPSAFITNSVIKDSALHGIVHGFDGDLVNFRPTNTFEGVAGCPQTLPRLNECPNPKPDCDGL